MKCLVRVITESERKKSERAKRDDECAAGSSGGRSETGRERERPRLLPAFRAPMGRRK